MAPRKREPAMLTVVTEPALTPSQLRAWDEGIDLFDRGEYWHAHERWEALWLEMSDDASDDAEIVIRGFVQLTAGLHLIGEQRLDGARSNLLKAAVKLAFAPDSFLTLDIANVRRLVQMQIDRFPDRVAMNLSRLRSVAS